MYLYFDLSDVSGVYQVHQPDSHLTTLMSKTIGHVLDERVVPITDVYPNIAACCLGE